MLRVCFIFCGEIILISLCCMLSSIGLILITSDGRLPNLVLRGQAKQQKTYYVVVDKRLQSNDVEQLRVSAWFF